MRQTPQRMEIERIISTAKRPLSPGEILDEARQTLPAINLATIYRNLNRLVELGMIVTVNMPGEPDRYELQQAAAVHHHHFRCEKCQSVYDLKGCVKDLKKLLPKNFRMTSHDIWLYGICKNCR